MIQDRTFAASGDFDAYHECTRWLESLDCSVGSMQAGKPTAVMFWPGCLVSKYRGLSKQDIADTHGWIEACCGPSFRGNAVKFTIAPAGAAFLAAEMFPTQKDAAA